MALRRYVGLEDGTRRVSISGACTGISDVHESTVVTFPRDPESRAGFEMTDGTFSTRIRIPPSIEDNEWRKMNDASLQEYETQHQDSYPESIIVIQKLFAGFVARHLRGAVLDVGCGIGSRVPLYARDISHIRYFGIDPIDVEHDREYPFICARIEDTLPALATLKFDGFIYATSLDHIRNPACAGRFTRALATAGARAVFWIGLHDPGLVARDIGATAMEKIVTPVSWAASLSKSLRWQILSFPRLMLSLRKRQRWLQMGKPLDDLHFHHFTEASARRVLLDTFGEIVDEIAVPGTNSRFYCVQIDGS